MKDNIKKKRVRFKIGDVFQIDLPDGRYAYGRVYNDASVGIYKEISSVPNSPPIGSRDFLFNVGLYRDVLASGKWPIVAHDKFASDESDWPAPHYIKDIISGRYEIYYKGEMRPSTGEECKGLEEAAVWDSHHIIDRILKTLNQDT